MQIARDARIFPLIALRAERAQHRDPASDRLQREGDQLSIERVGYELQRGDNEMLRILRG